MSGNPARLSSGLKCRLMMFWASRGVPIVVGNTSPLSCQLETTLSCLSRTVEKRRSGSVRKLGGRRKTMSEFNAVFGENELNRERCAR